jgi:hypothetical protein
MAYAEPTDLQRHTNWNNSLKMAISRHGERAVLIKSAEVAELIRGTDISDVYYRQPDPVGWAMNFNEPI